MRTCSELNKLMSLQMTSMPTLRLRNSADKTASLMSANFMSMSSVYKFQICVNSAPRS